jgi:hypothetical protein
MFNAIYEVTIMKTIEICSLNICDCVQDIISCKLMSIDKQKVEEQHTVFLNLQISGNQSIFIT